MRKSEVKVNWEKEVRLILSLLRLMNAAWSLWFFKILGSSQMTWFWPSWLALWFHQVFHLAWRIRCLEVRVARTAADKLRRSVWWERSMRSPDEVRMSRLLLVSNSSLSSQRLESLELWHWLFALAREFVTSSVKVAARLKSLAVTSLS
jgi:hypothetical protein